MSTKITKDMRLKYHNQANDDNLVNNYGSSFSAVMEKEGLFFSACPICYASLYPSQQKIHELYIHPRTGLWTEPRREQAEWILNESPWKDAFLTKDVSEVSEIGCEINIHEYSWHHCMVGMAALRAIVRFSNSTKDWGELGFSGMDYVLAPFACTSAKPAPHVYNEHLPMSGLTVYSNFSTAKSMEGRDTFASGIPPKLSLFEYNSGGSGLCVNECLTIVRKPFKNGTNSFGTMQYRMFKDQEEKIEHTKNFISLFKGEE